jgi:hypothetical protein
LSRYILSEEKEDAARNAFNLGLDIETVQKITGLSVKALETLRKG